MGILKNDQIQDPVARIDSSFTLLLRSRAEEDFSNLSDVVFARIVESDSCYSRHQEIMLPDYARPTSTMLSIALSYVDFWRCRQSDPGHCPVSARARKLGAARPVGDFDDPSAHQAGIHDEAQPAGILERDWCDLAIAS